MIIDWENPEARSELRLGDIVETDDCAYLGVREITEDGIRCQSGHLWSWSRLNSRQARLMLEERRHL
jgi:hypothetical protein